MFLLSFILFDGDGLLSGYINGGASLSLMGLSCLLLMSPIILVKDFNLPLSFKYAIYLFLTNLIHFRNIIKRTI